MKMLKEVHWSFVSPASAKSGSSLFQKLRPPTACGLTCHEQGLQVEQHPAQAPKLSKLVT